MRNRYKKRFRLKKQKEISYLVRNGKKFKCDIFVVLYEKNNFMQDRFNVLISRKNGNSAQRVRIKRIYREAYVNTEVKDEECFYDILIRPEPGCKHEFCEIKKLYGKWRNETVKDNDGKYNILSNTVL
ncbi:MAG: ribonuclease P protein component [Chitinispirillales bacterium]|nr:ribonuclease P protein component [Chitinispirillales bacterium]